MIRDFEYYIKKNLVRKGSPDKSEADSLIDMSQQRHKYVITSLRLDANTDSTSEPLNHRIRSIS